jgi:hypothetical protein
LEESVGDLGSGDAAVVAARTGSVFQIWASEH